VQQVNTVQMTIVAKWDSPSATANVLISKRISKTAANAPLSVHLLKTVSLDAVVQRDKCSVEVGVQTLEPIETIVENVVEDVCRRQEQPNRDVLQEDV